MKEDDTTIVAVLNSIFSPLSKKRVKELGMTEEQESRYVNRLSHEIESSGKDGAIANGERPQRTYVLVTLSNGQ